MAITSDRPARRTYDADEAFALLGIARSTGFDLITRGDFPAPVIRAGRRIYVPKDPLDRLLSGRENHGSNEPDSGQAPDPDCRATSVRVSSQGAH